jgi:prepilin-type N-terminal cleavage/methylation domain-containing protein
MKNAFTLIELAAVISIIGLVVGGIMLGQNMVRSAEVTSLINEVNQYSTAIHTFQKKYQQLPGDMVNAANIWSNCVVDPNDSDNTCNGNGNGRIELLTDADQQEVFRAWQHLSLSEMIPGSYTGFINTPGDYLAAGENAPESKLENGIFSIRGSSAGDTWIRIGAIDDDADTDSWPAEALLTPAEAYKIDKK